MPVWGQGQLPTFQAAARARARWIRAYLAGHRCPFGQLVGTLVAPEWGLTAAHGLSRGKPTGEVEQVVVGRHDLTSTGGETLKVDRAYPHPGFRADVRNIGDNDIALLHLKAASRTPLAPLVRRDAVDRIGAGAELTAVGWGERRPDGGIDDTNVLRQVTVPLISDEACAIPQYQPDLSPNMMCTGSLGHRAEGDDFGASSGSTRSMRPMFGTRPPTRRVTTERAL
jgi:secreted trypsin-like serine protease